MGSGLRGPDLHTYSVTLDSKVFIISLLEIIKGMVKENYIGKTYTNYTVVRKIEGREGIYECLCKCGNVRNVGIGDLKRGTVKSCGCWMFEMGRAHGKSGTREHRIWKAIKTRCTNPNQPSFKYYGARGITIHDKYKNDFMAFLTDIGPAPTSKHTVDRIDTNKGYEPGNIRWATYKEQANNKRNNSIYTHKGITMTLSKWGDLAVVDARTIMHRLKRGWEFGRAISTPMRKGKIGYQIPDEQLKEPTKRRVRSWRRKMAAEEGLIPPIERI
jgi:hypothetical protein